MGNVLNLGGHRLPEQWVFDRQRMHEPDFGFRPEASFPITERDRVLVMGSCFAKEIQTALADRGMATTDAGLGLQYNAPSMLQQIAWSQGAPSDPRSLIVEEAGTIMDPCAYQARNFATSDEALQARAAIRDDLSAALRGASVIVFTFGLIEVWTDQATGVSCNVTPPASVLCAEPARYRCHRLTHAENLSAMRSIFRAVRAVNPSAGIIATVSPVPLAATFLGPDVLQANSYSKSTLRSALGEAIAWATAEGLGPIDYFPSYELVTLTDRAKVWREESPNGKPDGRHVLPEFVRKVIIGCFARAYLGVAEAARAEASSAR